MELQLSALDRVVAKYRRDVHHLPSGATADAVASLEGHLCRRLPQGHRSFMLLHNGATLFRGALRLRSASQITLASEGAPQVVLFADGPDPARWAWAEHPGLGFVFGTWDGESLTPVYTSFVAWLSGEIEVLETRPRDETDRDLLRLEVDPTDPVQRTREGRRLLATGQPEQAARVLQEVTHDVPELVLAWQVLGDALAMTDRAQARQAWLQAFRRTTLPLPWPGASVVDADVMRSLGVAFTSEEVWERELQRFLDERVADVVSESGHGLVVAASTALARSRVQRGRRSSAREVLAELVSRCQGFSLACTPWAAVLDLARLELSLGHHDDAEALLRRVRREGPAEMRGEGQLLLAELAIGRQEPWAEDILDDASQAELDDAQSVRLALLRIERAVRNHRPVEAERWLEGVARRAHRVGVASLEALSMLAQGDVERLRKRYAEAEAAYRRGLEGLGSRAPEVRGRLLLRIADLSFATRDLARSDASCRDAAKLFSDEELPVREAWALLRLARLRVERDPSVATQLLNAARERFTHADLAAGVAAADSLAGDPGANLAWHLERATAQARARHDAQRSRPPWERADADRPERRLGAHRLAIAACDLGVVSALAQQMDACARAASVGRGRALDPPVIRYVAAVDLLAGHRSYEAARVLLDHLLDRTVDGAALRALQGAIARSPNAALVDGLLRCIEQPERVPAHAVAAAAELLGLRREPAGVRALVALAAPTAGPVARKAAVVALGRVGDRSAVEAVAAALDEPSLAEQAALALLMLGDRRGVDFHARALVDDRTDLSGSPGEIVGRYGGPEHLLLLLRAARGETERSIGALQGLGLMGDPRAIPTLLGQLHARNRRVVEIAAGALQILTGHDDDPELPGVRARWHQWWEETKGTLPEGTRHRHGRVFDCGLLLERMAHSDAYVRRTSYDELVITSGQNLPFDSDGPWRVQRAHLRAWDEWWRAARHGMEAGNWVLDGTVLN